MINKMYTNKIYTVTLGFILRGNNEGVHNHFHAG